MDLTSNQSDYLAGALQIMDRHLQSDDLTFYITWKLSEIPSYGKNVVAITLGDEWSRIPAYAGRVLCTFKWYGIQPQLEVNPLRNLSYLNALLTFKYLRTRLYHLPSGVRHAIQKSKLYLRGKSVPPVYELPLGYGNQINLPVRPILERSNDIFFAGSTQQQLNPPWWSLRRWLQNPKNVSRSKMVGVVDELNHKIPSLQVKLHTNSRFALNALAYEQNKPGELMDEYEYSNALMNSKICLAPRGTSAETFRFFEGLRYGCVVITERLPSRWFYDDAPVLYVDDWNELYDLVPALLADSERLQRLHKEALQWWEEVCSEEAVGQFIAEKINEARG